jgi:hypothetical protein
MSGGSRRKLLILVYLAGGKQPSCREIPRKPQIPMRRLHF